MNDLAGEVLANAAFERVKGKLLSIPSESLLQVSLDIWAAVATVLGVVPEVRQLRAQMVKELPSFDVRRLDKLEDYALALSYAQARYLSDLEPVASEAAKLREKLLAEAKALVHHGVVNQAQLSQLKGANGYKNVATDVTALANVETALPQIQGRDPDDRYGPRAGFTGSDAPTPEHRPAQIAETSDFRLRAYTTHFLAYEDVRRAVTYLRGAKDDADSITPSLHPGRPRQRRSSEPATGSGTLQASASVGAAAEAEKPALAASSTGPVRLVS